MQNQNTEKTVEEIVQEFEHEEGVQSAPISGNQEVVSNIKEIICNETLPEEPKVEVDDNNIEIIDISSTDSMDDYNTDDILNTDTIVDDNNIRTEIIDLTGDTDKSDDNNKESPVKLRDVEKYEYRAHSFRLPTRPGENTEGWFERWKDWREAVNEENRRIRHHNRKARNLQEDIELLEDCPSLLDTPTPNESSISNIDTTLNNLASEIEEDLQDELEEERNDPERDFEWETGIANRCQSEHRRKRWWKYTGFCPEYMTDRPYNEQVDWIMTNIFEKIRKMTGLNFTVLGIEVCPETHRVHCHALLYFDTDKRFNTLKKELPGQWQWLESNRGTSVSQAILNWYNYVIKSRTKKNTGREIQRWEREPGTIDKMMTRSTKRTFTEQFADNYDQIMARDWQNVERDFLFQHANKIGNFLKMFPQPGIAAKHDKLVFVWGPTRVGKSSLFKRWIPSRLYYQKTPSNRWFDGYDRQPIVIIDEVKPRNFQADGMDWNDWGDRYSITAEVKHGTCNLCNEWLIVISNYSLRELCTRGNRFDNTLYQTFKSRCGDRETGFYRMKEIRGHMEGDKMISEYNYNDPREVKMMIHKIFGPWANDMLKYYEPTVALSRTQ